MRSLFTRILPVALIAFALPVSVFADSLTNPLGSTVDIISIIAQIIRVVLGIVGIVTVVFVIYGGILMLVSAGNPERVKKGQDTLIWAVIGLVIIFGSYGIAQAIFNGLQGQSIDASTPTTTEATTDTATTDDAPAE